MKSDYFIVTNYSDFLSVFIRFPVIFYDIQEFFFFDKKINKYIFIQISSLFFDFILQKNLISCNYRIDK